MCVMNQYSDIACRNVLLKQGSIACICDFGLSVHLPEGKEEMLLAKNSLTPLNIAAPETLRDQVLC